MANINFSRKNGLEYNFSEGEAIFAIIVVIILFAGFLILMVHPK